MTAHETPAGQSPPTCPDCGTATAPFTIEDGAIWRCTNADCRRRTYGLPDGEDDENLPPYEEDGLAYHGTGELDAEATDMLRQLREEEDDREDST